MLSDLSVDLDGYIIALGQITLPSHHTYKVRPHSHVSMSRGAFAPSRAERDKKTGFWLTPIRRGYTVVLPSDLATKLDELLRYKASSNPSSVTSQSPGYITELPFPEGAKQELTAWEMTTSENDAGDVTIEISSRISNNSRFDHWMTDGAELEPVTISAVLDGFTRLALLQSRYADASDAAPLTIPSDYKPYALQHALIGSNGVIAVINGDTFFPISIDDERICWQDQAVLWRLNNHLVASNHPVVSSKDPLFCLSIGKNLIDFFLQKAPDFEIRLTRGKWALLVEAVTLPNRVVRHQPSMPFSFALR